MEESQSGVPAGTERAGKQTDCFTFWVEAQRLRELFLLSWISPLICVGVQARCTKGVQREKRSFWSSPQWGNSISQHSSISPIIQFTLRGLSLKQWQKKCPFSFFPLFFFCQAHGYRAVSCSCRLLCLFHVVIFVQFVVTLSNWNSAHLTWLFIHVTQYH